MQNLGELRRGNGDACLFHRHCERAREHPSFVTAIAAHLVRNYRCGWAVKGMRW
jgi:hypothetical protein